jgi:hypothetical protein
VGGKALISPTVAGQACATEGEMEIDTFPVSSSYGSEAHLSKQHYTVCLYVTFINLKGNITKSETISTITKKKMGAEHKS